MGTKRRPQRGAEGCFLVWKSCCWVDRPSRHHQGDVAFTPPCPTNQQPACFTPPHTHSRSHKDARGARMCMGPAPSRRLPWALVTRRGLSPQEVTGDPWGQRLRVAGWQGEG